MAITRLGGSNQNAISGTIPVKLMVGIFRSTSSLTKGIICMLSYGLTYKQTVVSNQSCSVQQI